MSKKTYIKVSGVWEEVVNVWRKVSGVWQDEVMPWIKVSGTWKECMLYIPPDSVSIDPISLKYPETGGSKTTTVTSSGAWSSSIQRDRDSIISNVTASGGDGDDCTITLNTNTDTGVKFATVRITVGSVYEDCGICQDGTVDECF